MSNDRTDLLERCHGMYKYILFIYYLYIIYILYYIMLCYVILHYIILYYIIRYYIILYISYHIYINKLIHIYIYSYLFINYNYLGLSENWGLASPSYGDINGEIGLLNHWI